MDLNKKVLFQAYNPFFRLAIIQCCLYALYIIIFMGGYILATYSASNITINDDSFLFVFLLIYVILCLASFRIPICSLIEKKRYKYEKILVRIQEMETDGLFGDYKGANQEIKYCYPSKLAVERIKIICVDINKKKYRLRMIGSEKKMKTIREWFLLNEKNVYFIYGKYTKIILWIEWPEVNDSLNYNNAKLLNAKF